MNLGYCLALSLNAIIINLLISFNLALLFFFKKNKAIFIKTK
jgi:hypothetical protein